MGMKALNIWSMLPESQRTEVWMDTFISNKYTPVVICLLNSYRALTLNLSNMVMMSLPDLTLADFYFDNYYWAQVNSKNNSGQGYNNDDVIALRAAPNALWLCDWQLQYCVSNDGTENCV